jgi:predicted Zn-dependent protease
MAAGAILKAVWKPALLVVILLLTEVRAAAPSSPLIEILAPELERNLKALKAQGDPAPYFLSYAVTEIEAGVVTATQGALQNSGTSRSRVLDVSMRVGSPKLDNYRRIRGDLPQFTSGQPVAINDEPNAIRQRVWLETDRVYRIAQQRLLNINTNQQLRVSEAAETGDFSPAEPVTAIESVPPLRFNVEEWAAKARKWSADFGAKEGILASSLTVLAQREIKTLVSSEGTRLEHGRNFARIVIAARAKAADGMDLATQQILDAADPARLPDEAAVKAAIKQVESDLLALLKAEVVEPYVGPAILSGRASGVFFHEIFGHRIEGHRQQDESEGQTFAKSVGQPILPAFLSVRMDPTRRAFGSIDLNGWYAFDDEGVKARPVTVVDKGVLRNFLLSRTPIQDFPESNGHGRRQAGREVVPRQSNLIVESANQVPERKLRELLIDEVKKRNKPFGLYFKEVDSGYTTTARRGLQAFSVVPLLVYRVFPDGRPDELVRGADIVGTPLAAFSKIVATADKTEVFNGICGAESGGVPVSAASPAILVSEVEIQKKPRSLDRPPILPPPGR